ncbi:response regulator [Danxiaibacter flavus]|uniref:Response regulator n=1 Tax=Danxiaibacter flavus TaxID=3049108 RepID=A0ABV3ZM42_9BACT|nr:response regulator [Chitinophagaceae bacterium DXS]
MKKILVIEDNDDIRSNTAEILELSNYEVITAENGKIGLVKALEIKPDLIICDITMPELDGYGVIHAVQKNESIMNTPFIFLTARTERSDFRKAMDLGADDYLTKPFSGTELLNAVNGRLRKMEDLKRNLAPGLQNIQDLLEMTGSKDAMDSFTEGRNVNKYKKKQTIYTEGNHPNSLYFIVKGKAKAYKTNDDGKELVTELYDEGDFLGYVALLEGTIYKDTATAMEDSEIAIIPRHDFDELINHHPQIARKFIQLLARNVSEKEKHLVRIAYNSLRKKVADALLIIIDKYDAKMENKQVIDISRENLATIAGTATESLIRTLTDFKSERIIDINDGHIIVLDKAKLQKIYS